jgi:hypothetical protein
MWKFFQQKANREMVGWVCSGIAVLASAIWVVFLFFADGKPEDPPRGDCTITAADGSIATCGSITNKNGNISAGRDR